MSLSSSLFTGTSGLKNMGNALQVVGNNISNLNTVGFKRGRSIFADTLYESVATQAGSDQMGRGMSIGSVSQNFGQGSFESTGNTTDLSIGGDGFFIMRQSNSDNTLYTRAGNFFFNKDGQLVNPEGYIVQGWELDEETGDDIGAIKDLVLKAFTSPPKKSSRVTAITNLNADSNSNSIVLSNNWDAGEDTVMAANNYEYHTVVKVFDALGSTHDVSVFYDKKSGTEWEYIVTSNPDEDKRNAVQRTDSKGLLARGTIMFSQSSGDIIDFTMSEFTGRLGNFKANGVNSLDAIHYEIINYDEMPIDGYGFEFEFDGSVWNFVDANNDGVIDSNDKPTGYPDATIVYSDNSEVHLVMAQTLPTQTNPDLRIKFDQPAVATDSFGFDINDKNDLHVQGIEGTTYFGDTANDNTSLEINDPSVMTHDATGLGIVWNPSAGVAGEWFWSNPGLADTAGSLVSGVNMVDAAGNPVVVDPLLAVDIHNPEDLTMVVEDIKLRWDGAAWDWNEVLKAEDFTNVYSFSPTNDPNLRIVDPGTEGAIETPGPLIPELFWYDAVGAGNATDMVWSLQDTASTQALTIDGIDYAIDVDPAYTNSKNVRFTMLSNGSPATPATIEYRFGSALTTTPAQSIAFTIDPTPPQGYAAATLTQGAAAQSFEIDFDSDNTVDVTFDPVAGGAAVALGTTFLFSTNPNVPPEQYRNATLMGDQEKVVIDLDGSGNDSDSDDIVFRFDDPLKYGSSTHPYNDRSEISFDILGSTAWTEINKNDIEKTGYFAFTTDFLGGDFGSTRTDIQLDLGSIFKDNNFVNDSLSTTQYSKSSSTVFQDANGYSAGDLQAVDVASDGIMTGSYSNGQLIPLFRVGLAKFLNNYGLFNAGGNLFRETRSSGGAITNKPGENGLGTIAPNSLEMSNVDIAEEFVGLITNQRGFQANSKTITTVDDMMQTVIQMKR